MTRRRRTRASLDTLWTAALSGLAAWILVSRGLDVSSRPLLFGGAWLAFVGVGLLARVGWMRVPGALSFVAMAVGMSVVMATGALEVTLARVLMLPVWGWAAWHLLRARTRAEFAQPPLPLGRLRLLTFGVTLVLVITLAAVVTALDVPFWATVLVVVGALFLYEWRFAARFNRWLAGALAPRPADVASADWPRFRAARRALARQDHRRVAGLLAEVADGRSVRILRGLSRMERACASDSAEHVVFCGDWVAPPSAIDHITVEVAMIDVAEVVAARVELLDALCEDAGAERSSFDREFEHALETLSGRVFATDPVERFVAWWQEQRHLAAGEAGRTWAVLRFIDAWCIDAARIVAGQGEDATLQELSSLAAAVATPPRASDDEAAMEARTHSLMLAPSVADDLGLLLVGSPLVRGLGAREVSSRLQLRLELVDQVRELWPAYRDTLSTTRPFLLHVLTDCGARIAQSVERFDAWWVDHRADQAVFDEQLSAGFLAAQAQDWELAEQAFEAAVEAWPERQCGRFNLALAHELMGRYDEEEVLLRQLAEEEPKEALWRMKLGDVHLHRDELLAALGELEHAARLGGFVDGLSLRMGVVLARLGRVDEALLHFSSELGPDADPSEVRGLVDAINRIPPEGKGAGIAEISPSSHFRWPEAEEEVEEDDGGDDGPPPTFH